MSGVPILECNCQAQLVLKTKKDGKGFYLGCRTYPNCKTTIWFPSSVKDAQATDDICQNVTLFKYFYTYKMGQFNFFFKCLPKQIKKIRFKFERSAIIYTIPTE